MSAGTDGAFRFADDLGPEKVVELYETSIRLKAVVVIDNVAAGPAIGGVRMAPDVSVQECFRLARAMTMKNAAAGRNCIAAFEENRDLRSNAFGRILDSSSQREGPRS